MTYYLPLTDQKNIEYVKTGVVLLQDVMDTVQMQFIFLDSKEIVDMPLKFDPQDVETSFQKLKKEHPEGIPKDDLYQWCKDNFFEPGTDCEETTDFPDWQQNPEFLNNITDPKFKEWARELNNLWIKFGKKTTEYVKQYPERNTLIDQKKPFLVPGGRFREFYYWDSFWLIKGILICGMKETAKGMIENMLDMVDKFGFIPNGSRTYYLNRSQPPLLSEMVFSYFECTKDINFIKNAIHSLEKEYCLFMNTEDDLFGGHGVKILHQGKEYILNRYSSKLDCPRPESYREDLELAEELGVLGKAEKKLFSEVAAACESGWDFTCRWFQDKNKMNTIYIRNLIPLDLNCIMYRYELNLEYFHKVLGQDKIAEKYAQNAQNRKDIINSLLYNTKEGIWFDYDYVRKKQTGIHAASCFFPLWCGIADQKQYLPAINAFQKGDILQKGGVVGTAYYTRQQWDYPNAWPPLQWFLVEGMLNTKLEKGKEVAQHIAKSWTYSNFKGFFLSEGKMYEKYDVRVLGYRGFGGEYEPQDGFGWSNGTILCFMERFGDLFNYEEYHKAQALDDDEYKEASAITILKSKFNVTKGDMKNIAKKMIVEMETGLAGQKSSLKQIPTFVTKKPLTGKESGKYIALDVGGSKYVIHQIFLEEGKIKDPQDWSFIIPEDLKVGKGEDLFDWFAERFESVMKSKDEEYKISLTFSFPVKQDSICSGSLIHWTKGFRASGVVGKDIVALFEKALKKRDFKLQISALVNNTVGTLMSGYFHDQNCHMGMIVGAGANLCYWEKIKNIKKLDKEISKNYDPEHEMIINMEWGNFGKDVLPRTRFDIQLDSESTVPGQQPFEKMVSGLYIAEIVRLMVSWLMDQKLIRSNPKIKKNKNILKPEHIGLILEDKSENLDSVKKFFSEEFGFNTLLPERKKFHLCSTIVVQRAGRLVAAGLSAVANKTGHVSGSTVAVDGAVYSRMKPFERAVDGAIMQIFGIGADVKMRLEDGGSGQGACFIGCLQGENK